MRRITVAFILSTLAALTAACMNGGAVPPAGAFGRSAPSFVAAPYGLPVTSSYSVIHSFAPSEGNTPEASPIVDAENRLYGTTKLGGTSSACGSGCGTIYRLSHDSHGWKETTLWSFDLYHGAYPSSPLVADTLENLYGATDVGGNLGVAYGLFHDVHGLRFRDLHSFQGNRDGAQPRTSLILDRHGNLYGTTIVGGTGGSGGNGTVYELTRSGNKWTETIIHRFFLGKTERTPQALYCSGATARSMERRRTAETLRV